VVETEIAARRRGGGEWRHDDAVAVAVLARPRTLEPSEADLVWAAAGLGVTWALDELLGGCHRCIWPDGVEVESDLPEVALGAVSSLGPGRIDHAAVVARLAPVEDVASRDEVIGALVSQLRSVAATLDEPAELLREYRRRCAWIGRRVAVRLLPTGSARGLATTVDATGALVLESPTGFQERIPIGSVGSVEAVDDRSGGY
jgi:biotin-(acetyl-CoA carboxylase) ligase